MKKVNEKEKITKSNQSVEKVLTLLEILAKQSEPIRLNDCAKKVGINASTTLRLLTTLQRKGYVAQDVGSSRYFMTMKICALSGQVSMHYETKDICAPFLRSLSQIFMESVNLSIEHEMKVLYIDVVNSNPQMLTTMQRIGNTAPMHCTGSGKLMLLNYDENQLERFLAVQGLPSLTDYTINSKERLLHELEMVKRRGYSMDNQECTLDVRCIAAPVYDYTGKVIAGISISGPISRMTDEMVYSKLPYLLDAAREVSVRLGYDPVKKNDT